jgi:hypothetical protein
MEARKSTPEQLVERLGSNFISGWGEEAPNEA